MSVRQVPRKKGCRARNQARRPQRQLMSLSLRKTHIMNLCVLELANIHGFKQSILLNIFLAKECSPSNLWLSLTTDIKTLISTRSWARPRLHLLRLCHWWNGEKGTTGYLLWPLLPSTVSRFGSHFSSTVILSSEKCSLPSSYLQLFCLSSFNLSKVCAHICTHIPLLPLL